MQKALSARIVFKEAAHTTVVLAFEEPKESGSTIHLKTCVVESDFDPEPIHPIRITRINRLG